MTTRNDKLKKDVSTLMAKNPIGLILREMAAVCRERAAAEPYSGCAQDWIARAEQLERI